MKNSDTRVEKSKYLYIKNGDVVEQLLRVRAANVSSISSGPDAFIWDFLQAEPDASVMVLSRYTRSADLLQGPVSAIVINMGKGIIERLLRAPVTFLRVFLIYGSFRPTKILCGTTGNMLWACLIISKVFSRPLVYSGHNRLNLDSNKWHQRLAAKIDEWCISHANAVICHGPYLRDQLVKLGIDNNRIFEFDVGFSDMLIDIDKPSSKQHDGFSDSYTSILFIGRIEEDKGVFDLLHASVEKLRSCGSLRLVYVGKGSELDRLKSEINRLGLANRVICLGMVLHQELAPLMKKCRFIVTPTRGEFPEGRCMVAMEGLVMGKPVVAPDFGPFPYIVKHEENGLLYKSGSVEDLKKSIIKLLDDANLYEKLKSGAEISGRELVYPPLTFGSAVRMAFSLQKH